MTDAPEIPSPKKQIARLRKVAWNEFARTTNPLDRKKLSDFNNLIDAPERDLPGDRRPDGRASHPTRLAVVYAALLQAEALLRAGQNPEPALAMAETLSAAKPGTYVIVGDQDHGWTAEATA